MEQTRIQACIPLLVDWYAASRRLLPWREEPTPYHVWISEIMLQQTRIEAVIPYYHRFLQELPTVEALAAVEDDRLMKLWEGLGYYSRARNLKKAAVQLVEQNGGRLPRAAEELRKLPGIGDYTAGAISSIAYGQPEPAVDGNVLRVLTRVLACGEDIMAQKTRKAMAALLRSCYPAGQEAGLLTEGIMELGETICIPNGEARCELCPIRSQCLAHQQGRVADFPVKAAPKERRVEKRTILLLEQQGRYAIRQREKKGLLAGLWELPNWEGRYSEEKLRAELEKRGIRAERLGPCGEARHIFSHVEWHMEGWSVSCSGEGDYLWKTPEEIQRDYPIPTAYRFYTRQM